MGRTQIRDIRTMDGRTDELMDGQPSDYKHNKDILSQNLI